MSTTKKRSHAPDAIFVIIITIVGESGEPEMQEMAVRNTGAIRWKQVKGQR